MSFWRSGWSCRKVWRGVPEISWNVLGSWVCSLATTELTASQTAWAPADERNLYCHKDITHFFLSSSILLPQDIHFLLIIEEDVYILDLEFTCPNHLNFIPLYLSPNYLTWSGPLVCSLLILSILITRKERFNMLSYTSSQPSSTLISSVAFW